MVGKREKLAKDIFGYENIPRNKFIRRLHLFSGLSYGEIGRLMKWYNREIVAMAVVLAKRQDKADIFPYVLTLAKQLNYEMTMIGDLE